jgi:hypothetical protein
MSVAAELGFVSAACQPPNNRLQRTAERQRRRAASAAFHCAHAARWTQQRAAAEPDRYTA